MKQGQLWYAPILAVAMGLNMARLLLLAKILLVPDFAQFSAGLLVANTFTILACLGTYVVLQRDLPVLIVRMRERRGLLLLIQCMLVALSCAILLGLLSPFLASMASIPPSMFAIAVWYGLSQQLFLVVTVDSRSRGDLILFANQNLFRAMAIFVAGLTAALASGSSWWLLAAESTVSMALLAPSIRAMLSKQEIKARVLMRLGLRRIGKLPWRSALVLLTNNVVIFFLISADRWLAANQVNPRGFAQYSFIAIVLTIAQAVQAMIGAAVFPSLARRYGVDGGAATLNACRRYSLVMLVSATLLSVPTWYAIDFATANWYPAYFPSGDLLALLLMVAAFRVSDFWSSHLTIVGKERLLLKLNLLSASAATTGWLLWVSFHYAGALDAVDVGWFALSLSATSYMTTAWAASRSIHHAR